MGVASVEMPDDLQVATDDWPFLYLRAPMIPNLSIRGAAIMAALALLFFAWFIPPRPAGLTGGYWAEICDVFRFWRGKSSMAGVRLLDGQMFFLGAGFMLVETKAVIHMALLFGSTWMVNSIVFTAVLFMILAANVFVWAAFGQDFFRPFYACLFLTLAMNALVPLNLFLGWTAELQIIASCLLVFAPILFAGMVFALSFSQSTQPDRSFGFNIAGAMVGGLAEYRPMLLGFQHLLWVAVGFYALSTLLVSLAGNRSKPPWCPPARSSCLSRRMGHGEFGRLD